LGEKRVWEVKNPSGSEEGVAIKPGGKGKEGEELGGTIDLEPLSGHEGDQTNAKTFNQGRYPEKGGEIRNEKLNRNEQQKGEDGSRKNWCQSIGESRKKLCNFD